MFSLTFVIVFKLLVLFIIGDAKTVSDKKHQSGNIKYVRANENVVIDCRVDGFNEESDKVEWCKNEFCTWGRAVELADGRLKFNSLKKYYIVGNWRAGEWSLLIENVTESDSGEFKCTVTRHTNEYTFKFESTTANLVLMEKPVSIVLNGTDTSVQQHDLILNQPAGFYCAVQKGRPTPHIYWSLVDSNYDFSNGLAFLKKFNLELNQSNLSHTINLTKIESPDSYFHFNWLNLNVSLSLANKSLVCVVEHQMLVQPLVKSFRLNVKYAPVVSIFHEPNEPLIENRNYTFYCSSKSNPADNHEKKKFYMLDPKRNRKIEIRRPLTVDKLMNSNLLICESENEVGKTTSNVTLNVLYPPQFVRTPEPLITVNRSTNAMSLSCQVDSNPRAVIFWLKNDKEVIQIGERLKLVRGSGDALSRDNFNAEYTCQARTTVFDSISRRVAIVSEGAPTFIGDPVYHTSVDRQLDIEFTILSNPSYQFGPICTKLNDNGPLEIILPIRNKDKYRLESMDLDDMKISTKFKLIIDRTSNSDVGFYNCTVTNKHGISVYTFEIRKKSQESSFWFTLTLLILALLVILLLIASIFVLIVVQKRRNMFVGVKMCRKVNTIKKGGLPNVSDFSGRTSKKPSDLNNLGYQSEAPFNSDEILDPSLEQATYSCKKGTHDLTADNNHRSTLNKSLSDDYALDKTFKKQSNQISLIEPSLDGNNFSFESLTFTSDTQNLLLFDNFKSVYATAVNNHARLVHQQPRQHQNYSAAGTFKPADIQGSKFQTNV